MSREGISITVVAVDEEWAERLARNRFDLLHLDRRPGRVLHVERDDTATTTFGDPPMWTWEVVIEDRGPCRTLSDSLERAAIEATCAGCGDVVDVPGGEDPSDTLCVACATDEQEG